MPWEYNDQGQAQDKVNEAFDFLDHHIWYFPRLCWQLYPIVVRRMKAKITQIESVVRLKVKEKVEKVIGNRADKVDSSDRPFCNRPLVRMLKI